MAGTIKHEWTGTVLTITSDSGTSSCDLKGEKGDDGVRGAQGKPGGTCYNVSVSPTNLLDNSYFINPINQRGQTVYTGIEYTIDRWRTWGEGNITVGNGYISASQSLWQYVANIDASKTHTAAICLADGRKYVYSGIPNNGGMGEWGNTIFCGVENGRVFFRIEDNMDDNIVWAALYEGTYTADTLPAYQYKGYAAELAECMRYYYKQTAQYAITPYYFSTTERYYSIALPCIMRVNPTFIYQNVSGEYKGGWLQTGATVSTTETNTTHITVCCSGGTVNDSDRTLLFVNYEVSADL